MTIAEAIRMILHQEGQAVLRDAARFRALMRDHCFDAPKGELHITCVLLSENHVERLRGASVSATERERIQGLLYNDFGFDKEIISRAISNWACVLGSSICHVVALPGVTPDEVVQTAISMNAQGNHREAENVLREGMSLHPSSAHLHATLATTLRVQGRLREALAAIGRARQLEPDDVNFLVYEADLSLEQRNHRNKQLS